MAASIAIYIAICTYVSIATRDNCHDNQCLYTLAIYIGYIIAKVVSNISSMHLEVARQCKHIIRGDVCVHACARMRLFLYP